MEINKQFISWCSINERKNLVKLGSKTAKSGFRNEQDVIDRFNDWQNDKIAKAWLNAMSYDISDIEYVKASKVRGQYKTDIQVKNSRRFTKFTG